MLTRSRFSQVMILVLFVIAFMNGRKYLRRQRKSYKHSKKGQRKDRTLKMSYCRDQLSQFKEINDQKTIGFSTDEEGSQSFNEEGFVTLFEDKYGDLYRVRYCLAPKLVIAGRKAEWVVGVFRDRLEESVKNVESEGYEVVRTLPSGFILFRRRP